MGNAGSAHNLHNDCVDSELNSYYTQQYLRQTTKVTKKKYNQVVLDGWSSGRTMADCKVLPKKTENLKLRPTINGAILHAGGTISFRAKEQTNSERTCNAGFKTKNEPTSLYPMRRCHTLILDGQNEQISRKTATPLSEFRRSQTLLHIGYNRTKSQDNISKNVDCSFQPPQPLPQSICKTSTLKVNKYNKKRKAPPAPTKVSLGVDNSSSGQKIFAKTKSTSSGKPRIYATNSNKIPSPQKLQQQQIHKLQLQLNKYVPIQRECNTRKSISSSRPNYQTNLQSYSSKLPYRREKSFDAVLLRQNETSDCIDKRTLTHSPNKQKQKESSSLQIEEKLKEKPDQNVQDNNEKKTLTKQYDNAIERKKSNTFVNNYHVETNYIRDCKKIKEPTKFNFNKDSTAKNFKYDSEAENQTTINERKTKHQQSRIPQLKRTFYFGMEAKNKTSSQNILQAKEVKCRAEKFSEENEDLVVLNHKIEAEEQMVDNNGILVHVRPTLPKRQLDTPSFSPAAAWRNLLEEQQRLQQERTKRKQSKYIDNSRIIELPIYFTSSPKDNYSLKCTNWTPQQDLEDDDEKEDEEDKKCKTTKLAETIEIDPEKVSNSLHIFSLSLPRDVHLQCQMKSSADFTEQENNLKVSNYWLVPGFNSLQKFKTHLNKKVNFQSSSKCTCASNIPVKRNNHCHQNVLSHPFTADFKNNHQPDCDLNKTSAKSPSYHNDNWLLHKSKLNDASLISPIKAADDSFLESSFNTHSLVSLQPESLTNICGGKHIVYLPGQDAFNASIKNKHEIIKQNNATKSTYKRQRQRLEIVRENLQDLTPIQNIHQSNISESEKTTQRFSFQSTVRVLEKRRLAEKLSKDAEIQEAQRLNELEVMKRVEEDFQRKRAPEKANLRNQLRLHFKATTENEEYTSLPLNINDMYNNQHSQNQNISDVNNNLFCRAEPDGAVSPSTDFNDNLYKTRHSDFPFTPITSSNDLKRFEFNKEQNKSKPQVQHLQNTASLIEPYLHSII